MQHKVKFVERGGTKVKDLICKTDPWSGDDCLRAICLICEDNKQTGMCKVEGICYLLSCVSCSKEGDPVGYVGESSHTGFERGLEHARRHIKDEGAIKAHDPPKVPDNGVGPYPTKR